MARMSPMLWTGIVSPPIASGTWPTWECAARPFSYLVHGREEPPGRIDVSLVAPSGEQWAWEVRGVATAADHVHRSRARPSTSVWWLPSGVT